MARRRPQNGSIGFTLVELLVVVIIAGILTAIALPIYIGYVSRAKQSEAVAYIGTINRAQVAYYAQYGRFTERLGELGELPQVTRNYQYEIKISPSHAQVQAIPFGIYKKFAGCAVVVRDRQLVDSIILEAQPFQPIPSCF